jgi:hypothetical protein
MLFKAQGPRWSSLRTKMVITWGIIHNNSDRIIHNKIAHMIIRKIDRNWTFNIKKNQFQSKRKKEKKTKKCIFVFKIDFFFFTLKCLLSIDSHRAYSNPTCSNRWDSSILSHKTLAFQ